MRQPRFSRIRLKNWRNFRNSEVALERRAFLAGANAAGKSNFLDVFRFLRDLVLDGGGLAKAVDVRGGLGRVRSIHQKGVRSAVAIEADVVTDEDRGEAWQYTLAFNQARVGSGVRADQLVLEEECVKWRASADAHWESVLSRPDSDDGKDSNRLTQTAIQQVNANKNFRDLADFFASVSYLHLVPQLIREGQTPPSGGIGEDALGRGLLGRMRGTPKRSREARLKRLTEALKCAVPEFEGLSFIEADDVGRPHLQVGFKHWRKHPSHQDETQLSDGTLRLIGLLWAMQEKGGPLLLEEPELSLNPRLVRQLAPFMHKAQKASGGRQVLISTHSEDLLADEGIGADEVLVVLPGAEGSTIRALADDPRLMQQIQAGLRPGDIALPLATSEQLDAFGKVSI